MSDAEGCKAHVACSGPYAQLNPEYSVMLRDVALTLSGLGLLPLLLVHAGALAADAAGWSGRPLAGCSCE
jgi:hypothetical protein